MRSAPGLLIVVLCLAACGSDVPPPAVEKAGACRLVEVDRRDWPMRLERVSWGQEIWISYETAKYGRTHAEALAKAQQLCREVHGGGDIGQLARRWSNGAFGVADGLCVTPEPAHRDAPDVRDVTLHRTPIGKLTPLIEWREGFWFARRVAESVGRGLDAKLKKALTVRAKARSIHIHYAGAFPRRHEFDNFTKQQAITKAWALIRELEREDGPSFADLSRKHNNDAGARERDGLLMTKNPRTKEPTPWIRHGDRNFSRQLLEVVLETGEPGVLWPEPVVSGQGVDIVLLVERRTD